MIFADTFYKSLFGTKTYKISLDAGCTCPTRDGTLGTGGCIFCGEKGSGEFASCKNLSVTEQIKEAKRLVDIKFSRKVLRGIPVQKKYIAYFQNFTNTYGDLKSLEQKWRAALAEPDITGLALGTRPDCISDECLKILSSLQEEGNFIQLELGFQTSNELTAEFFRRGYKNNVYFDAVQRIHKINPSIHVVTHLIFGLPTGLAEFNGIESEAQMLDSVRAVVNAKSDGIKIANLFVLKNTRLSELYENKVFRALEYNEYLKLIQNALEILPENMVVHRLSGDPPRAELIAPSWSTDKKRVMNDIRKITEKFIH